MRVEWCKSLAWKTRWTEEVMLIREEMWRVEIPGLQESMVD